MIIELFETIPARFLGLFEDIEYPWDPLNKLKGYVKTEIAPSNEGLVDEGAYLDDEVEIGEGTIIEHGAIILGPAIIGKNCFIRSHAYIRGNVVIGDNCVVGHATEIVRSILLDHVRVDHLNYVGDSILGNYVHFGAGAKIANTRFDKKIIMINGIKTGREKFGGIFGDHCQFGVNVTVGPGVICEPNVWLAGKNIMKSGVYTRDDIKGTL